MKTTRIAVLMAALGAALFIFSGRGRAADGSLPIYFANQKLTLKSENVNRAIYIPVKDLIEFMGLPYTDATALETLTIRSGNSRLTVTKNSALMSLNNDQIVLLPSPMLHEGGRWLAPLEFLSLGLTPITNMEFRYRPGSSRIFAGDVDAPELVMNAQTLGPITRLTIRCAAPVMLDLRREDGRAILAIDRTPLDPLRERMDHRDRLVRSIAFDDSNGNASILVETTAEVADIKITGADNNRLYFVDFLRKGEPVTAAPPPAEPSAAPAKPDTQPERKVRVIVIDPGHGGMDTGSKGATVAEKDLTLGMARRLRTALQTRLGATVLLTRDADIALDNEARSAVANNNQANLFISLHIGYSANKLDSSSSVFVMKEDFGEALTPAAAPRDQLFLPWYLGYRTQRQTSGAAAKILQEELNKAIPGWKSPIRPAPLAILSSATMPALLLEVGNLNNPINAQTLADGGFQNRLVATLVDAIQRFSETPQGSAN